VRTGDSDSDNDKRQRQGAIEEVMNFFVAHPKK
jgi:hypothetical protein